MWTTTEVNKWLEPFWKGWVSGQRSDFKLTRGGWLLDFECYGTNAPTADT
jgi:hypothetical protein